MKGLDNNTEVFFTLVRAGLWEKDARLLQIKGIDYGEVYRLAQEQSVVGLVAAGLEHVVDIKAPKEIALSFAGEALQLEQRNIAMNIFIGKLVEKMRNEDINTLLVKGQGIALCYERPLWRASGDIDFYLNESGFRMAKSFFRPLVSSIDPDCEYAEHINMHYDSWVVEIHANQYCYMSSRIDRILDVIHRDLFFDGNVISKQIGGTTVFLPAPDNNVLIVFTHFLNHFYKGGLGIRQICDWCRLLWTYRVCIDKVLLETRLKEMGLISEWKAFSGLAVNYLGMPAEALPLYDSSKKWSKKANRIMEFLLEVGNFGHNRDTSYYAKYPFFQRKVISFWIRIKDMLHHVSIFPLDSIRFLFGMTINGFRVASHGE